MSKRNDWLTIMTIVLMMVTSVTGILSWNLSCSYEITNLYGQTVKMYGYGLYSYDTYFQAPISIGTDICILFLVVPIFVYTYINYCRKKDKLSELKLISMYAVAFYYAASLVLGLTYNQLFLEYLALFACSIFGMFMHIKKVQWSECASISRGGRLFLIICGFALVVAWLPDVIPSIIKGTTLSLIGVYTTCITYVLDMGIISPLCFVCIYLMKKRDALGTMLMAIMMKLCMVVGVMMIPQGICQLLSGYNMSLPAFITKSMSFVLLGGSAFYFNKKLYRELENVLTEYEKI